MNMNSSKEKHYVVAIDGTSGSGKSSTARIVAKELGILHLDTGAMYRAVTFLAQEKGIVPVDAEGLKNLLSDLKWEVDARGHLRVNGRDLSREIRTDGVTAAVSDFARIPMVREALVPIQREIGLRNPAVVEGRDMATVVFPNARFKFFMYASPEVRAKRRVMELKTMGQEPDFQHVLANLIERDHIDSSRQHSPLAKAPDAVEIDTSGLTFADQVAIIVSHVLNNR